jgi:hypothetical protein
MKTTDFSQSISSTRLAENLEKQFGVRVNLNKYDREQLEDIRNKLRTRVFQQEASAGVNDLLTNEDYQKDKAMLELLNIRIKEMLGEDIKKLRDKMVELSEGKKGVRQVKHSRPAKGSGDDKTGDGKKDFDDIQVARMTAGGVPKKQAIAKATSDNFKEGKKPDANKNGIPDYAEDGKGKNDLKKKDAKVKEGFPTVDDAKKAAAGTAGMKAGEKKKSSTGGTIEKTATGLKHTAGKNYSGKGAEADKSVKESKECANGHTKMTKGCDECAGMWESDFSKLEKKLSHQKGVTNPAGLAAKIGRDKYGKDEMARKAAAGRKKADESAFKQNVRLVNESLNYLLQEDEEGKAKTITAAGDMVNDFTSWMQRVGQYQTKAIIELSDEIRAEFGQAEAETFKQAVGPALSATLETLTSQREAISNAVAQLATGTAPPEGMGMEPGMDAGMAPEPGMDATEPDAMNPEMGGDEFAASDAAAGGPEASGREMRESKFSRKLQESHSIISKLAA